MIAFSDVEKERSALENVPPNLYESVCVPDLSEFLGGYQSLTGGDQKVANSGTSSGHPPSAATPTPSSNATAYLHDGKYVPVRACSREVELCTVVPPVA